MKTRFWLAGIIAAALTLTVFGFSAGGGTAYADEGACGNDVVDVPDAGSTFDFTDACEGHDACYAEGGTEADRTSCDNEFLDDMRASCSEMWPTQFFKRLACQSVAGTYYLGVRLGGWAFFPYS